MNIRNLTVSGPANGFVVSTLANNVVYGIWFNDAGGTVDNVTRPAHLAAAEPQLAREPDRKGHPR